MFQSQAGHTIRDGGLATWTCRESGKILLEVKTVSCCHCGHVIPIRPGSGITRGFCFRCNAIFCGPGCLECVPEEQYLENLEQGRAENFRPISVSFGGVILP